MANNADIPSIHFDNAAISDITAVTEFVEEELDKLDCPMKSKMQIDVAIDELFSNIVRYAYGEGTGPATVEVFLAEEASRTVALRFSDSGTPYNPLTRADPDTTLSAEDRSIGGLGIFMVKKTMDDLQYRYENGQNILTIYKKI